MLQFEVRPVEPRDFEAIAVVHRDSILGLGPNAYPPDVVAEWGKPKRPDGYGEGISRGESLFVAVTTEGRVLGFSFTYAKSGRQRIGVYVVPDMVRQGIATRLFEAAEAVAKAQGATSFDIDASVVAVRFYEAMGFESAGEGEHVFENGSRMKCIFMHKSLP